MSVSYDDRKFLWIEAYKVYICPMRSGGDVTRRAFIGSYEDKVKDKIKVQVFGVVDNLYKAVFLKGRYVEKRSMAGPKGFLP